MSLFVAAPAAASAAIDERASLRPLWWLFLALGLVSIVVGIVAISSVFVATMASVVVFGVLLLIAGFFQSLQLTATQAIAYADVSNAMISSATSIASMSQQLSRGFGIAVVASVLHLSLAWRGATELALTDFHLAFGTATVMALLCLAFVLPLAPDAASEVSGHRTKASGL